MYNTRKNSSNSRYKAKLGGGAILWYIIQSVLTYPCGRKIKIAKIKVYNKFKAEIQ